ncbi:MAG: hypothetical protein GXP31_06815 [Kiritimatiellaeota bacterium]|nr:hypothetical protein [Kiritimatiellota bacterium]
MNPFAGSMQRWFALLLTAAALIGDRPLLAVGRPAPKKSDLPAVDTAIPVRCGRIVGVRTTDKPVLWRDLDKVLAAGRFRPSETDDESTLTRRPPADGRVYVVVDIKLAKGRSIGKYDWKLAVGNEVVPCLALARDRLPFDARNWEYRYDTGLAVFHLLFEAPADLNEASLVPALPLTLKEPAVRLDLTGAGKTGRATPPEKATTGKRKKKTADKNESTATKPPPKPKTKPAREKRAETVEKPLVKPPPTAPAEPKKSDRPKPAKKPKPPAPKPAIDNDWM